MTALIQIIEGLRARGLVDADLKISRSDISYPANDPLDNDIDLVVRSTAIAENDPDYIELKKRGVTIWHRSDMLTYLSSIKPTKSKKLFSKEFQMSLRREGAYDASVAIDTQSQKYKQLVVSGTHGKTTCTAMLAHIFEYAGFDPSYAVGGVLANYNNNGKAGEGDYFILEGDESDKSYLKSLPYIAMLTYVEPDHLENYPGGFEEIRNCFLGFLERAEIQVVCVDDQVLADWYAPIRASENNPIYSETGELLNDATLCYASSLSFGQRMAEAVKGKSITVSDLVDFYIDVESQILTSHVEGTKEYKLELGMDGHHNLINATGAIAVAWAAGINVQTALKALKEFKGIKRRFELVNASYTVPTGVVLDASCVAASEQLLATVCATSIKVYDDYAHHPTELKALIQGALAMKPQRLVMVFQPHHPERTQQLWNEFIAVMRELPAQHLMLVADIYVARSKHIPGVESKRLVEEVARDNVRYLAPAASSLDSQGNYKDMVAALKPGVDAVLREGDMLIIAGAGNISKIVGSFSL